MNTRPMHKFDHKYLFGTQLGESIECRAFCFDENPEFHEDGRGAIRGLQVLQNIGEHFSGKIFLILTAQKLSYSRSDLPKHAYDLFWKFENLNNLKRIELKVDIGNEIELPVAVIDISDFNFNTENLNIFNVERCICVLTHEYINTITDLVKPWVLSYSHSKIMSLDQEAMTNSLDKFGSHSFVRYIQSHNGWYETLAVAGPKNYLDTEIFPAVDKALSGTPFSTL